MMIERGYEEMIALDDTSQTTHETIADFLGVDAGGAPGNLEHCLDPGMWGRYGRPSRDRYVYKFNYKYNLQF